MTYTVHSIFKTIQGEGFHAGRVAVFCRFAGCNLWSGLEKDRATAVCQFCDTEFMGGKKYEAKKLADEIAGTSGCGLVVFTGGEPLLQLDEVLTAEMQARGFAVHVETNGTIAPPLWVDWLTVSPKAGVSLADVCPDELKIIFPQGMDYEAVRRSAKAKYDFLQPMDGPEREANTAAAIDYILEHPWWRLSIQTHKFVGIA